MIIEDGTGSGKKARVRASNQLEVFATNVDYLAKLNRDGGVWSLPIDAIAPSGATKFIYILNIDSSNLGLATLRLHTTVAGVYRFTKVTGTPSGGTAIVPTPLNLGSTLPAPVGCESGASITGLSDAGLIMPLYMQANVLTELDFLTRWVLTPNTAIAITAPAAAVVSGMIIIFSDTVEE
jgi:hypothetical protein